MAIETRIIEVTSTDRDFLCRLIDWLNDAEAKESSTVVRLRDGHAAFTEDELTRLNSEVARLKLALQDAETRADLSDADAEEQRTIVTLMHGGLVPDSDCWQGLVKERDRLRILASRAVVAHHMRNHSSFVGHRLYEECQEPLCVEARKLGLPEAGSESEAPE